MAEKIFTKGLVYKVPRPNAPGFVKGSLSFQVEEFVAFLREHVTNGGWVNVDIKESKGGKLYCELDTFKPQRPASMAAPEPEPPAEPAPEDDPSEIPF